MNFDLYIYRHNRSNNISEETPQPTNNSSQPETNLEMKLENSTDQVIQNQNLSLHDRLESIEKKFLNLQTLKDDTNNEFVSLLADRNFILTYSYSLILY